MFYGWEQIQTQIFSNFTNEAENNRDYEKKSVKII